MTNPIQYIRNYFAARRMKREREEREKQDALFAWLKSCVDDRMRSIMAKAIKSQFPSGGISTPMTNEGGEFIIPPNRAKPFRERLDKYADENGIIWHSIKQALESKLAATIAREDYEEAARLRDEIKKQSK